MGGADMGCAIRHMAFFPSCLPLSSIAYGEGDGMQQRVTI